MDLQRDTQAHSYQVEHGELCIVGAGMAGLNALFVASQYLSKKDRVILVDRNPKPGGMWNETYDYVRLHQPHRMFTAGNIDWAPSRERAYLASKSEVLAHFDHCINVLRERVTLIEHYGYAYEKHCEVANGDSYEAHITCAAVAADTKPLLVKAKSCVKAFGFTVPVIEPLSFSSANVTSTAPHDGCLFGAEMAASEKPIYIVGGGKTGMDTAHALVNRFPDREINLVVGKGTMFFSRNKSFPKGLRRWWGGITSVEAFLDLALKFTGDNEAEVLAYFRNEYAVCLDQGFEQYMFGIMSVEENAAIAKGVNEVLSEYVADIVDVDGETKMLFKSGQNRSIKPGSWVVNCTGYIMRDELEYEPYLSPKGTVVSVQPTSGIHFLTTFSAYFLVHLFYLGKLDALPLYEMNYNALARKNKALLPFAAIAQALYNILMIIDAVPFKVMNDCGLDFNRWYPLHRRVIAGLKLAHNKCENAATLKAALDRFRSKHAIKCGLLERS